MKMTLTAIVLSTLLASGAQAACGVCNTCAPRLAAIETEQVCTTCNTCNPCDRGFNLLNPFSYFN